MMKNFKKVAIQIPDILLPKEDVDFTRWAVIACDQFTSEPEYWENVKNIVGNAPSTLNLILPEVYLGKPEEEQQTRLTHQKMEEYLEKGIFESYEGLVLVERTVGTKTRHGIVLALDLEQYNYNKGSQSLIRATEGTILDRLPPRMKIREGAVLELPHILVLIDDPIGIVIEPLVRKKSSLNKLYDFELMLGSGHLKGYLVDQEGDLSMLNNALEKLADKKTYCEKYGVDDEEGILLFAMGDGNHSLATAKAIWEKIRDKVGMDHPARYALVEIENIHDKGLEFEPIHRVIFNCFQDVFKVMKEFFGENFQYIPVETAQEMKEKVDHQSGPDHWVGVISDIGVGVAKIADPSSNLPVGTLQTFLDDWLSKCDAESIDYVHGFDSLLKLGTQPHNLGFYLPAMEKSDLFKTVILDGALPRKTFSMGEAYEKRFYLEARRIT
jgi:hypothetical protein